MIFSESKAAKLRSDFAVLAISELLKSSTLLTTPPSWNSPLPWLTQNFYLLALPFFLWVLPFNLFCFSLNVTVPQGFILGPHLYQILPAKSHPVSWLLFASNFQIWPQFLNPRPTLQLPLEYLYLDIDRCFTPSLPYPELIIFPTKPVLPLHSQIS